MIRQCFLVNTGIQFYRESFKDIGLDPDTLYPFVTPRPAALAAEESVISRLKASAHNAEPTDATLTDDEVQAPPTAASTFKTEEDEELVDALCPIYDELQLSKVWWTLELIPLRHKMQTREDLSWTSYWRYEFHLSPLSLLSSVIDVILILYRMNLGRPREIPRAVREKREKIYVHRSVKIRMEAEGLDGGKYVPRARFENQEFEWVD